ncbi:glycosyltransferase family 2 protein [Singulisphaera sp. GP187]|uniref:glycosyltransferase family 2 protein n=1 Tax=Singulisphaera sp. GP187 TaxID=1882752 RepID=UPI0013567085|nr:glycosyltransferase family 2 protein [Singulisphaera sp. GP187]
MLWTILFVTSATVIYVYAGYPLALTLLQPLAAKSSRREDTYAPSVTLIIPAYNEALVIQKKIENSLGLDYPRERLEIIVSSDGSNDGTNEIVRQYEASGVILRAFTPRAGKISVLNLSIPEAIGDIIVLCDANVMFRPDVLRRLMPHFADPEVGAVTGDVRIQSEDAPFGEGEGLYYKYERLIQLQESRLGSTVTVDGGLYALRRELFHQLPTDTILDDFVIGMNVAIAGRRVLYDPSAVATENATIDVWQEFHRKVRIVAGAFRELLRGHGVPRPRQIQLFWSYLSHKLLRWLVPWCLLVIFGCTLSLAWLRGFADVATAFLTIQLVFYACALIGCTRPNARWPAIIGVPFYFCMINTAAWIGSLRGLTGIEKVTWNKASR